MKEKRAAIRLQQELTGLIVRYGVDVMDLRAETQDANNW
jgi:hypothetical protein